MKRRSVLIAGTGIFFLLYIVPLGVRPMVVPDEFRYAEIPREMLQTGNWIVPHLDGLRYFEKPVLGYWLNAAAIALFGENAFAVRFPSAIAVGLTALLLFAFVRRFSRDDLTAPLATAIFLLFPEVYAIGSFCVLDSVISLFVTAAIVFSFWAYFTDARRPKLDGRKLGLGTGGLSSDARGGSAKIENAPLGTSCGGETGIPNPSWWLLALAGLSCGLAFLTKGFIALVVPAIVIVPLMLWQRRLKSLLRTAWVPLVTTLLFALPWSIAIYFRQPDFWRYFFWVEHVDRFISPKGGQHPYPFWFYVPVIMGGAMPWTLLVGSVVKGLKHVHGKDPIVRLALCWLSLPFLFFSASRGKLGTYILPCFPALAVLASVGLLKYFAREKTKAFTVVAYTLAVIAVALIALLIVHQTTSEGSRFYNPQETWKAILVSFALLTWTFLGRRAATATDYRRKLVYFAAGPAVFMFCAQLVIPAQSIQKKTPGEFLAQQKDKISPGTILVSDNYLAAAVCWTYKRSDVYLLDREGEFAYGLGYDDSRCRLLNIDQLRRLITTGSVPGPRASLGGERGAGTRSVALITYTKRYVEYEHLLPKPTFKEVRHGFIFARFACR
ncbi:MAG: phospholipid carrier-dependent glycosyltransferase [Sedimentisphaerales bacterium]